MAGKLVIREPNAAAAVAPVGIVTFAAVGRPAAIGDQDGAAQMVAVQIVVRPTAA